MITRWYEILCDFCGCAERFLGNIQSAESQYKDTCGIITKDKKHYCNRNCHRKANKEISGKK